MELLDSISQRLQTEPTYRTALSSAIASMLYYKIRFYMDAYKQKAESIILSDQEKVIKKLCTIGQVKPVVEYKDGEKFYTMTIPNRTRTDPLSKETVSYTEEEYIQLINSLPNPDKFNLDTQCTSIPATGVVYDYSQNISSAPPATYPQLTFVNPSRKRMYDIQTLLTFLSEHPEIDTDSLATKYLRSKSPSKSSPKYPPYKKVTDAIYSAYSKQGKSPKEVDKLFYKWIAVKKNNTEALAFIEADKSAPESEKKVTVLAPQYETVKSDIDFYTSALAERQELLLLIESLISQFNQLCSYTLPIEQLQIKSPQTSAVLGDDKISLDLTKIKLQPSTVKQRADTLIQLLLNFKTYVSGDSRLPVRNSISEMVIAFVHNWRTFADSYINAVLLGPPGSGKSETAKRVGVIMANLGILAKGGFSTHSRASIVGQYIGETAKKVNSILVNNLENVLFIDEAYAIAQGSGDSTDPYGVEAINEIVGFLDKYKGKICVIAAGYDCEMEKYWFGVNPGLRRRTRYTWTMQNFTPIELFNIIKRNIERWKGNNAYISKNKDTPPEGSGKFMILQGKLVGQRLYTLIEMFQTLLVNQAGDAEAIADLIISSYYTKLSPLSSSDIDRIMYSFLKTRTNIYAPKETGNNCANVIDTPRTAKMVQLLNTIKP